MANKNMNSCPPEPLPPSQINAKMTTKTLFFMRMDCLENR